MPRRLRLIHKQLSKFFFNQWLKTLLDHWFSCTGESTDAHHRLIAYVEMFRGTIDGADVYPREVFKEALRRNAAAVILAHNHPSGRQEPSTADRALTLRLKAALDLVDIRTLDHISVAGSEALALAERGLI